MNTGRGKPSFQPAGWGLLAPLAVGLRANWQHTAGRQRIGLIMTLAAVILLLGLPTAALLLSLNPYQPVIEHIRILLATQPGFEEQLTDLDKLKTTLLPAEIIQRAAEQINSSPNPAAAPPPNATDHQQQLFAIARSLLTLHKTLQTPVDTPQLAVWLRQLQGEDALLNLQAIEGIYRHTPVVLQRLYDIRRANLALSRQINACLPENGMDFYATATPLTSSADAHLTSAFSDLQQLNRTCLSAEIQLANTTYLLNQIFQEIEPVYRQDLLWGFSIWLKAAAWLWHHRFTLLMFSVGLLVTAGGLVFWRPLPFALRPQRLMERLRPSAAPPAPSSESPAHSFAAGGRWLVNGLLPRQHQKNPLRLSRRGRLQRPHLIIPVSGETPLQKPLPADGILRIGSDPSFSVKIPLSGAEYIELWIRKARKGYYLDVMFSDTPVLVNQRPVYSSHALNDGDAIQIHDTTLYFRER